MFTQKASLTLTLISGPLHEQRQKRQHRVGLDRRRRRHPVGVLRTKKTQKRVKAKFFSDWRSSSLGVHRSDARSCLALVFLQ